MKLNHRKLIFLAGSIWLVIGIFLLSLGIHFILEPLRHPIQSQTPGYFSIAQAVSHFVKNQAQATACLVTLCLLLGFIKGKVALAKSVKRQIKRIESLPNPAHLKYLYSKGYYLLIASMVFLGFLLRHLPITLDTRGAIDAVIGSALINGSMLFFRRLTRYSLLKERKEKNY